MRLDWDFKPNPVKQALKVPEVDSSVDISKRHLAMLRVILGGLFALVLTVAIESDCFFAVVSRRHFFSVVPD